MHRSASLALAALLLSAAAAVAQTPDSGFTRREERVRMRDGTRLFTLVLTPAGRSEPLPIIFIRTPYGTTDATGYLGAIREMVQDGYIFAFQDIRGRYRSEGSFVMTRPPAPAGGVDESTDTWDAIDWLVKNVAGNNGRVGMFGVSYDGWLTDMALIGPHPALKAVSPQASVGDFWMGDDFFHQGAFRQSYGLEYAWMMEASNDQSDLPRPSRFDTYDWYLSFPTLDSLARAVGAARWPTWRRFVEHPAYDEVWRSGALTTHLRHTTVPTLTVGGWWDQEDMYGPQATYRVREATDSAGINYLVEGPWSHGQWLGPGGALGNVQFGSNTSATFRREVLAPWFAYWLKGRGDGRFPEARVFDAGVREWRTYDRWPPAGAVATKLYLGPGGRLTFTAPAAPAGADSFVSDPRHPVPYRPRPVEWTYDSRGSRWQRWMTEDQRFVDGRPDVLVWQTEPLERDVVLAGDVRARLFASTTGSDADWVVKLIDVYPDSVAERPSMGGYELMVAGDVMRGRYRNGFERAEPIPPNTVLPFTVDLHQQAYTFRRGHRIMVQVQSTWFPLYDRNPQTFVPNIFHARAGDYRAATHRIARSARHPSHVEISVLP